MSFGLSTIIFPNQMNPNIECYDVAIYKPAGNAVWLRAGVGHVSMNPESKHRCVAACQVCVHRTQNLRRVCVTDAL
jgi:hypothetical protein